MTPNCWSYLIVAVPIRTFWETIGLEISEHKPVVQDLCLFGWLVGCLVFVFISSLFLLFLFLVEFIFCFIFWYVCFVTRGRGGGMNIAVVVLFVFFCCCFTITEVRLSILDDSNIVNMKQWSTQVFQQHTKFHLDWLRTLRHNDYRSLFFSRLPVNLNVSYVIKTGIQL